MHLAAALGTPVLALFGSTDMVSTVPLGSGIIKTIYHPVDCAPCLLRDCPLDHQCMELIGVEEVYHAANEILNSNILI
jgi:heptosyltransferase-2